MSAEQAAVQADVVVVGMGVGGEEVAGQLADAGLDVVGIEAELVGAATSATTAATPIPGTRPPTAAS